MVAKPHSWSLDSLGRLNFQKLRGIIARTNLRRWNCEETGYLTAAVHDMNIIHERVQAAEQEAPD